MVGAKASSVKLQKQFLFAGAIAVVFFSLTASAAATPRRAGEGMEADILPSLFDINLLDQIDIARARQLVDKDGSVHIDTQLVEAMVPSEDEGCTSLDGPFCDPEYKKRMSLLTKASKDLGNQLARFLSQSVGAGGMKGAHKLFGSGDATVHVIDATPGGTQKISLDEVIKSVEDASAKQGKGGKVRPRLMIATIDEKGNVVDLSAKTLKSAPLTPIGHAKASGAAGKGTELASGETEMQPAVTKNADDASRDKEREDDDGSFAALDRVFDMLSGQLESIEGRMGDVLEEGDERLDGVGKALEAMHRTLAEGEEGEVVSGEESVAKNVNVNVKSGGSKKGVGEPKAYSKVQVVPLHDGDLQQALKGALNAAGLTESGSGGKAKKMDSPEEIMKHLNAMLANAKKAVKTPAPKKDKGGKGVAGDGAGEGILVEDA